VARFTPNRGTVNLYNGGFRVVYAEELIHKSFSAYGCIQEIRVFKEKGYAFIRSVRRPQLWLPIDSALLHKMFSFRWILQL